MKLLDCDFPISDFPIVEVKTDDSLAVGTQCSHFAYNGLLRAVVQFWF